MGNGHHPKHARLYQHQDEVGLRTNVLSNMIMYIVRLDQYLLTHRVIQTS